MCIVVLLRQSCYLLLHCLSCLFERADLLLQRVIGPLLRVEPILEGLHSVLMLVLSSNDVLKFSL